MEENWIVVEEIYGDLQAEILRGLLEAQEIPVILSQEGAGHSVYSVGVGALGRVQILIPVKFSQQARQLLKDYYAGRLVNLTLADEETGENNPPDDAGAEEDQG